MDIIKIHPDLTRKKIRKCTIPTLGMGTYELKGKECEEGVIDALQLGYRHIDTAQEYDNEEAVGKAIKEHGIERSELFLTDKIWWENLRPDDLRSSFDTSLQKLQTDYVDLLLIHWPSPNNVPLNETLEAMRELRSSGRVKFIGVSNFNQRLMKSALTIDDIICNQVEYHPFLSQHDMLELAKAHSFFVTAYSPLAQGQAVNNEVLKRIGEKHGKQASQVALRWLIQQHLVVAIPRTSSHEHRKANLEIFDFELTEEEMETITMLTSANKRLVDPDFAPDWD